MKTSLLIFAVALGCATAWRVKRQDVANCGKGVHQGKQCVAPDRCLPKLKNKNPCTDFEDLGYSCVAEGACNPPTFTPRLINTEVRHDQAVNASCPTNGHVCCLNIDIDNDYVPQTKSLVFKDELCILDGQICCPNEDVVTDPPKSFDCYSKKTEGYGCNENSDCDGDTIDTDGHCCRKSLSCGANTCCIKKQAQGQHCSAFEDQKYQCTPKSQCNPQLSSYSLSDFKRDVPLPPQPAAKKIRIAAENATCDDKENYVCCHISTIDQPHCDTYEEDGFSCTDEYECLDFMFHEMTSDESNLVRRRGHCRTRFNDGDGKVCCKHRNPQEREERGGRCQDSSGYRCTQIQNCRLDQGILKSAANPLITGTRDSILINNTISKCEKQDEVCCKHKRTITDSGDKPLPPHTPRCGTHNPTGLGSEATQPQDGERSTSFGEWPFTCLLYGKEDAKLDTLIGGASLIAPGVLVTATHKLINDNGLINPEDIRVRCGEWDIDRDDNEKFYPAQDRNVASFSIHPQYKKRNFEYTLALLHLEEDFELNRHLDTVCLPKVPEDRDKNYLHSDCVVMGWGNRAKLDPSFKNQRYQSIMEAVHNLPIVENEECKRKIRPYKLHDSLLCAGGANEHDACQGDGGGPLVCPLDGSGNSSYVLAGVTTAGVGDQCGLSHLPGQYASVVDNLCFIHWATRCKSGMDYKTNYWYPQCDDWMDNLKKNLRKPFLTYAIELERSCTRLNEV